VLLPEIERQQKLGKEVVFRADAAFAKPEDRRLVLDQLAAAAGENRRTAGETCPLLSRIRKFKI